MPTLQEMIADDCAMYRERTVLLEGFLRGVAGRLNHIASKIENEDAAFAIREAANDCLRLVTSVKR